MILNGSWINDECFVTCTSNEYVVIQLMEPGMVMVYRFTYWGMDFR